MKSANITTRFPVHYQSYIEEARQLSGIAGPLILSSLVSMGVSIIDLTMMAWLGAEPLAAGAVVSDYYSVFFYFFAGILASLSSLVSRARGARQTQVVTRITQAGFLMATFSGLIGFAIMWNSDASLHFIGIDNRLIETGLPYAHMMGLTFAVMLMVNLLHYFLSAHGNTRAIFIASLFALPFNALGNYSLMFGNLGFPEMGLAGAGLASFLAATFMLCFLLIAIVRQRNFRSYALLRQVNISLTEIYEIIRVGLPIGISNLGEMGVFLLATVLIGKFGTDAVAAHVVALRMAGVIYAIPLGYAQAATVRVGYVIGAREFEKVFTIIKTALIISLSVGILYLLLISSLRFEISTLFFDSSVNAQSIILQSSLFLLILAIAQPFETVGTVGNGILRGFKDTRQPMLFSMLAFWGCGFFGGIIMAFYLGWQGTGLWLGLAGGSMVFGTLIGLRLLWQWRSLNLQPAIA